MAALQVVLGQPGLESERQAHRAVIKVELLNQELSGKPIVLEGLFVGGSAGQAQGKLMQVRCLSTCLHTHIYMYYVYIESQEQLHMFQLNNITLPNQFVLNI